MVRKVDLHICGLWTFSMEQNFFVFTANKLLVMFISIIPCLALTNINKFIILIGTNVTSLGVLIILSKIYTRLIFPKINRITITSSRGNASVIRL